MNNVTTAEQPPDSLLAAMAKARIPADNHQFIRRITAAIGIAEYRAIVSPDKPYIVAKRRDGLPDLHIYRGYTTGFITEQESPASPTRAPGADPVREREPGMSSTRRVGCASAASVPAMFGAREGFAHAVCSCRSPECAQTATNSAVAERN